MVVLALVLNVCAAAAEVGESSSGEVAEHNPGMMIEARQSQCEPYGTIIELPIQYYIGTTPLRDLCVGRIQETYIKQSTSWS